MSEMSMNRPGKGKEDVQGYPVKDDYFDPPAEGYREVEEAVFIGTEGERPDEAHGDVLEDVTGDQIEEEELPD